MRYMIILSLLLPFTLWGSLSDEVPVSYKGRIRPLEAYAKLLYREFPQSNLWSAHFAENHIEDEAPYFRAAQQLMEQGHFPNEIARILETRFPLQQRLQAAGQDIKALPGIILDGEWYSLRAFRLKLYDPEKNQLVPIGNFTVYSDSAFQHMQERYLQIKSIDKNNTEIEELSALLIEGYEGIAGKPQIQAYQKTLFYPTLGQLKAERIYLHYPWISLCAGLYFLAFLFYLLGNPSLSKLALPIILTAFLLHTVVLGLRCYILGRPPVSNMFETVIYVPWLSVLASLIFSYLLKNSLALIASSLGCVVLLIILQITRLNTELENVQAVLDSQFWLIIHVLMVVGSYGLFILAGVLGHMYLISYLYRGKETPRAESIGQTLIQAIYMGTALLIPGTILGGVWAAQSWGRFWDWDPKESWAFISSCVYLMLIHAYRFKHIGYFGLAAGSVIGLLVISFTWYGVNYLLGTGMHSYGFGNGGEIYYYFYFLGEILFVSATLIVQNRTRTILKKN